MRHDLTGSQPLLFVDLNTIEAIQSTRIGNPATRAGEPMHTYFTGRFGQLLSVGRPVHSRAACLVPSRRKATSERPFGGEIQTISVTGTSACPYFPISSRKSIRGRDVPGPGSALDGTPSYLVPPRRFRAPCLLVTRDRHRSTKRFPTHSKWDYW